MLLDSLVDLLIAIFEDPACRIVIFFLTMFGFFAAFRFGLE
jgi:hypothetical protein